MRFLLFATLYHSKSLFRHPGCNCVRGFEGQHCELSTQANELPPDVGPPLDPAAPFNGDNGSLTKDGASARKGMVVIISLLVVISTFLLSFFYGMPYIRRRRRRNSIGNNIRWATKYQDDPSEVNLAPRRSSSLIFDQYSSSTDPFVTHLSSVNQAHDEDEEEEPEPQIYIGPPRDEDGHVLHNVDII